MSALIHGQNGVGPSGDWINRLRKTDTTVGYRYNGEDWRHKMRFGGYHPQDPRGFSYDVAILAMAHELGKSAPRLVLDGSCSLDVVTVDSG